MTPYLLFRRIALVIPMLFGVVTVTFFVTRILPGNPAQTIAGEFATPKAIAAIQAQYGFDKPLLEQYFVYLWNVLHLNFGYSVFTARPVASDLGQRLPSTLELVSLALLGALILGIPLGAWAARTRGRGPDRGIRIYGFVLLALPEFWLALMCIYFFFFKWGIAPAPIGQLGIGDPVPQHITGAALWDSILTANWGAFKAAAAHAAIPVITYALVLSAPVSRLMRSSMLEVLEADYIRFGRSCGLKKFTLWRYSVRASLPPIVTLAAIMFTTLVGGAVLVENIFSWGGAAQYAADAITRSDYSAVQGFVLVVGVASVIVFLIVDLLYVAIDPRVKL